MHISVSLPIGLSHGLHPAHLNLHCYDVMQIKICSFVSLWECFLSSGSMWNIIFGPLRQISSKSIKNNILIYLACLPCQKHNYPLAVLLLIQYLLTLVLDKCVWVSKIELQMICTTDDESGGNGWLMTFRCGVGLWWDNVFWKLAATFV